MSQFSPNSQESIPRLLVTSQSKVSFPLQMLQKHEIQCSFRTSRDNTQFNTKWLRFKLRNWRQREDGSSCKTSLYKFTYKSGLYVYGTKNLDWSHLEENDTEACLKFVFVYPDEFGSLVVCADYSDAERKCVIGFSRKPIEFIYVIHIWARGIHIYTYVRICIHIQCVCIKIETSRFSISFRWDLYRPRFS